MWVLMRVLEPSQARTSILKMDFEDFRKQRNATFLAEHELNDDQLEQLIEGKFKRARAYQAAFLEREEELMFD